MRRITHALLSAGMLGGLLTAAPAFADTAKPAAPTLADLLNASGITLTGYVDATYTYFNEGVPTGATGEPTRQFDYRKNSFVLNQAAITASYLPTSGFGALVNLIAGSDGKVLRNSEIYPSTTNTPLDVYQAYAQYAGGPFTVMAGKFATLAGAETVNPTTDTTVSRSLLFYGLEPLSHTGVRAVYTGGMGSVTVGLNNGWNYTSAPSYTNGAGTSKTVGKTFELGGSLSPSKMFSLSGAIYTGDAATSGTGGKGRLTLYDVVATINATDALTFVVNGDYKKQDNFVGSNSATAKGIAAYATYAFTPEWSATVRGEYVKDEGGLAYGVGGGSTPYYIDGGTSNAVKEGTLAVNYTPSAHVILRGEVRHDSSDQPLFGYHTTSKDQTSVALEAIYKF